MGDKIILVIKFVPHQRLDPSQQSYIDEKIKVVCNVHVLVLDHLK